MNPFRVATRAMLASYFVVNGVKALKEPEEYADETQQFAESVVPLAKNAVPQLPETASTWAMIRGGLQVVGGVALATGKGRRLGALLLTTSMVPSLLASGPTGDPDKRDDFLRNLALTGATLIAAGDLQGRPSVSYRLAESRKRAEKRKQIAQKASARGKARGKIQTNVRNKARGATKAATKVGKNATS